VLRYGKGRLSTKRLFTELDQVHADDLFEDKYVRIYSQWIAFQRGHYHFDSQGSYQHDSENEVGYGGEHATEDEDEVDGPHGTSYGLATVEEGEPDGYDELEMEDREEASVGEGGLESDS
jgi:hypothetical protein